MSSISGALHLDRAISPTVIGAIAATCIAGFLVSRLYLHPLSKFGGPRLAALTRWYEFYHDVIRGGTYVKVFPELHRKHGMALCFFCEQILHLTDLKDLLCVFHLTMFMSTIRSFIKISLELISGRVFKSPTEYYKAPYFYQNVGISESLVAILNPHKHRVRRAMISPLFSKNAMDKIMPLVQDIVEHAADILRKRYREGKSTDIQKLYRCITVDTISTACFGYTQDLTSQDENDIYPPLLASIDSFTNNIWLMNHLTFLGTIALSLPERLSEKIVPGYQSFRNVSLAILVRQCEKWIKTVKARRDNGILQTEDGRDTVFDLLLESNDRKGYQVADMSELIDEAFLLLIAGSDTTAYSLSCATYYILNHRDVLLKLKAELATVPRHVDGRLDCRNIQSLPYLTCVVKESLRLATPVPGISPRVVPPQGATVQGQFIPGGSIVSISGRTIHDNPDLFPEPEKFKPERWLGDQGKELERWNVTFSKGPRMCIGINLAYMEIYMILATFFADFDLSLHETDAKSMEWLDHAVATNNSNVKVRASPLRV
ncbi:cytochrome P450 [Penicillium odoratum]|uniref:cytochrome P450 n=1 Tax=Penicillium odoratum TaxID=1167516 RepID=UPI0025486F9A|nr:cytochrome P450 [Penicillium odoratum]KAJ5746283.1 cytochrome P450 [Penicillium odoratum]